MTTDWKNFHKSPVAKTNESVFRSLFEADDEGGDNPPEGDCEYCYDDTNNIDAAHCSPMAISEVMGPNRSKRKGYGCQVCAYEGRSRGLTSNVVICLRHRLRLCTVVREEDTSKLKDVNGSNIKDFSWRPSVDESTSCWKKAHEYYIPNGLFKDNVTPLEVHGLKNNDSKPNFQCVRVGSDIYKKKRLAFGEAERHRGRKRKTGSSKARQTKKATAKPTNNEDEISDDDDDTNASTDAEDINGNAKNITYL